MSHQSVRARTPSCSMNAVKTFFLAVILGLLLCDGSGVMALVSQESCVSLTDQAPDGKCPPQCARCACGVPWVLPAVPSQGASLLMSSGSPAVDDSTAPDAPPHEILHVPR